MIEPLYHDGGCAAVRLLDVPRNRSFAFELDLSGVGFGPGGLRVWRNAVELRVHANHADADCQAYPVNYPRGVIHVTADLGVGDVLMAVDERDRTAAQQEAAERAVARWRGVGDAR